MAPKTIKLLILAISLLIIGTTACGLASPAETDPQSLDVHLSLGANPIQGEPIPLIVEVNANNIAGRVHIEVTLPNGVSLSSGSLKWDEESFSQGTARQSIELVVQEPGVFEISVKASCRSVSDHNLIADKSLFVYSESLGDPVLPQGLNVAISPQPMVGQTVHIQVWANARMDLPNTTLNFSLPDGLALIGDKNEITQDLIGGETLELNAEVLVKGSGEWPIHFDVVSPIGEERTTRNSTILYLQVGTQMGNTITQFSMEELNINNEPQYEVFEVTGMPSSGTPEPSDVPDVISPPTDQTPQGATESDPPSDGEADEPAIEVPSTAIPSDIPILDEWTWHSVALYALRLQLPNGWTISEINRRPEPANPGDPITGHDCADYNISSSDGAVSLLLLPNCGFAEAVPDSCPSELFILKKLTDTSLVFRYYDQGKSAYVYSHANLDANDEMICLTPSIMMFGAEQELNFVHVEFQALGIDNNIDQILATIDKIVLSIGKQ